MLSLARGRVLRQPTLTESLTGSETLSKIPLAEPTSKFSNHPPLHSMKNALIHQDDFWITVAILPLADAGLEP